MVVVSVVLDPKARVGSSAPQHQRWTVGATRWRDALPYEVTSSLSGYRHWLSDRSGRTCGPSASGCPFPRPRLRLPAGRHQPGATGPRQASHSLPQSPEGAGAGEPSLPLPVGVAPPSQPPPGGWWASEPLAVYPTPGAVVGVVACRCAGPVGVGPRATLARATDNETHGLAIPARLGAHPLSPPHRSTGPRGTDTHLTGREGHRTAGRGLWRAPDQGPSPQTPVEAPLRPSALHDG